MTRSRTWSLVLLGGWGLLATVVVALAQPVTPPKAKAPDAKAADPAKADPAKEPPKAEPPIPADATATLTVEQIDTAIKQTQDSTDLDDESKATIIKWWSDAKSELLAEAAERAETAKAKQQLETLPAEAERIKKELAAAAQNPPPPFSLVLTPQTTSKQLELQFTAAKNELGDRRKALANLEDQLKTLKDEPTKLRDELKKVQADLDALEKSLAAPPPAGEKPRLAAARRAKLESARRARRAAQARIEQQLLTYDVRGPYLTALREQAAALVPAADQKVKVIQESLTRLVKEEAELAARQAEAARVEAINKDPQIRSLTESNAEHAKRNAALADRKASLEAQVADAKKQVDDLREEFTILERKIQDRGIDKRLARDLTKRRRALPNVRELTRAMVDLEKDTREIEEAQDSLQARRRNLDKFEDAVKGIMANIDGRASTVEHAEIEAEVRKLLTTQKELIGKQLDALGALFQHTRELEDLKQRSIEQTVKFSSFVDENLLWIADANPISPTAFGQAAGALWWLVNPVNWGKFFTALGDELVTMALPSALVILAFIGLLMLCRRVRGALAHIEVQLKRIDTDHFSLTPRAMLLALLLALPWPALVLYISIIVRQSWSADDFTRASAAGLGAAAISYYMLRTLIRLLKPDGIAEAHLRWTPRATGILRNNLVWLMFVLTPAVYIITTVMSFENDIYIDSLGRLVYIAFMIAIAVFLFRVLHPKKGAVAGNLAAGPRSLLTRSRYVWFGLALLMPLTPAVLAAIGYFYTARQIGGGRLWLSMWLLLGILLLHSLVLRWLYVAQRKLSLQKAREKRDARAAPEPGADSPAEAGIVTKPDTALDLAQINEQTRQIVRALLAIVTVIGLYLIWSGVLPALRVLDQVHLWAHDAAPDGTVRYITLASVLLAVLIGFLTAVAAKNVPGLLEITILKRTPLDAGGRYAFATITRYVITAIGIVAAFNAIGVGWSQVQWLIAAVSLGLGFGLQEIFANFVSGLIILFERPIRVGDTVTVGGVDGTVTRIRIRATTIVDADRKELIVPNKEFITGQIINWTLSDTITRVVIPVGVAYGSDLSLVQRLLADLVRGNPLVLDEPRPTIVFVRLGESSLDFELRLFVRNLGDRVPTKHDLLEAIDRAFREHGIEMPFPQRDLHVRSVPPQMSIGGNGQPTNGEQHAEKDARPEPAATGKE